MSGNEPTPYDAWCKKCGYLLRGLPEAVCPECGRGFDLNDPKTFDVHPPGWRRKRWIKRGSFVVSIAGLLYVFSPRDVGTGTLTLTCTECGSEVVFERYELRPPRWVPIRYFGWTRRKTPNRKLHDPDSACVSSEFGVKISYGTRQAGVAAFGYNVSKPGAPIYVNGIEAAPGRAKEILRIVTVPHRESFTIGLDPPKDLTP